MARLVVLLSFVVAHVLAHSLQLPSGAALRLHQGLLAWDGDWYLRIARYGYAGVPPGGLRFFPLFPLLGRWMGAVLLDNVGLALVLLANAGALAFGALVHRLCRVETGDAALARRATWLVALTPAAFVLTWGYSEGLYGCLLVGAFLSLRQRRWWAAAALGALAGLMRPVGALLAVPAMIEAARGARQASTAERARRVAAVVAPVVGALLYLSWVGLRFGNPLMPLGVQQRSYLRGSPSDPVSVLWRAGGELVAGHLNRNVLAFPWAVVLIVLVACTFRRWPASYGGFAAATLAVVLSTSNLGSFERYGFFAFPVVLTLAELARTEHAARAVLVLGAAAMTGYATLALLGALVP